MNNGKRCDFHTHTILSDGELLPMELIRRAAATEHRAIALTDHASFSNIESTIESVARDCEKADAWGIQAIPGVELTHVPVRYLDDAIRRSRKAGAEIIVVHGETPVEPVEPGTNHVAVLNPEVDILAHPGMISLDDIELAAKNGIFVEVTCRRGHSLTNGHVVALARTAKAKLLVNTDTHSPSDLSSMEFARTVALGAGLGSDEAIRALVTNPEDLLRKLGRL
ncbi:MAG: histidinol phosphate phosphatase domain-containing protein [Thermoplasmata archaeon]|nr:histidinol phosphate phosphatase domain-containing protein [Thermoplasmata archaeon]TFG68042.1 MAG: histidinol phosphate phosphatase domain-containing protein [Methanomassiliicoccus sp.]